ncbi:MAG: RsmD family RNA methyltransferase [Phycisphaeraceae bacterium]|nr:RsmD family RNA methyltransferase [Phycisphaeraceae bacterium]
MLLRIIAGRFRSRKLLGPADEGPTRPITDRIKESIFNRLMTRGLPGDGPVLDVFAGIGSFGLEAMSRGAEQCTFIERDTEARRRLSANIRTLGLEEHCRVLNIDALTPSWIKHLEQAPFQLGFLDPPYDLMRQAEMRQRILMQLPALYELFVPGSAVILRATRDIGEIEPGPWLIEDDFNAGKMRIWMLYREDEDDAELSTQA